MRRAFLRTTSPRRAGSAREITQRVRTLQAACVTALLLGPAACGDDTKAPVGGSPPSGPAPICKPPVAATVAFTDVTDAVGLGATDTFKPSATGIVTGDLDGDGYPDIVAAFFPSGREETGAAHTRFVLMNRPDPNDASARVFVDATEASGLFAARTGAGLRGAASLSLGDLDNDGDLDAVGCPAWGPSTPPQGPVDPCDAALNDGTGHFELAPSSGLDQDKLFWSSGSALLDFDRDGRLDYYPATFGFDELGAGIPRSRIRLYRGAGDGTFADAALGLGFPTTVVSGAAHRANFGVTVCDLDGDGDDDLITANYARTRNEVWRNDGASFTEIGEGLGVWHDENNDFSDDESYRCYCATNTCTPAPPAPTVPCNAFGGPYFRGWNPGRSDSPDFLGGNTFSITCGDIDDDGDMDLMTAEVRHQDVGGSSDHSELLRNGAGPEAAPVFSRPGNAATGLERAPLKKNSDEGDNIALFVDLDLDGRKDVYLASSNYPGNHPWVFHQKTDGTFEDVTAGSGASRPSGEGPAFFDYDRDGDLDLVIGAGLFNNATTDPYLRVYRNDGGATQNLARIRLIGKGAGGASVSAYGARVKLTAGGRTQVQELRSSGGHSGLQSEPLLTFGLGDACAIDRVEVRWPNQALTTTTIEAPLANYEITLTEGDDAPVYVPLAGATP